jgi:putative heme-binding domain-containing protein
MKRLILKLLKTSLVYAVLALVCLPVPPLAAQTPEWIWHDNKGVAPKENEVRLFRKTFHVDGSPTNAVLTAAGDNQVVVFLNGRQVASKRGWEQPVTVNVTKAIKEGENLVAVRGQNDEGDAAIIAKLELTFPNNQKRLFVTDTSWLSSSKEMINWFMPSFEAVGWTAPVSRGKLGVQPWGDIMAPRMATAADTLTVLPGFKVELIRSAEPKEGSWVSMTIDPKGRLILSPQEGTGNLLRATLSSAGQIEKLERIESPVGSAMGLLLAFDSLYVSGNGPRGLGLYRLRDLNGDDQFDDVRFLKKFDGAAGEHGSHALALGPDNKIYYLHGNFVKVPADISSESPHKHYAEDQLLPRGEDGNGFGVGIKPPGGFLLRSDAEGKDWELVAAGLRNAYDFDFNADGQMFTYDSDMEYDWGSPWYRPTRIYHLVSGGDYGFREGTGKFPKYYPDSLPPTLDISIGSPTGVKFGTKSKFPAKYQKALFAMDWSYGRIFAVHLKPEGATYSATCEDFVRGKPLNVTDLEFGQDGAMYFLTGGRGTQSGLYRVTYVGPEEADSVSQVTVAKEDEASLATRATRQRLESFHGRRDPAAVDFLWPHLNSDDRWIRYAARIALESQDLSRWQTRALEEERVNASLTALLALARVGEPTWQSKLLAALDRVRGLQPNESQTLEALRVLSLAFVRMGKPEQKTADDVIKALSLLYPARSEALNRELCQLLIYLEAPDVVTKTLALLDAAPTQEEQIHYVFHLRKLKSGWTMEQRRKYFGWFHRNRAGIGHPAELLKWFEEAGRAYSDGSSFPKFIANIRKDAIGTLSDSQRAELWTAIAGEIVKPKPLSVPRSFVNEWKANDLLSALDQASQGRSFAKGQQAFNDAQCIACHRFGNDGGSAGPDLTAVSSRFTRRDILDSIVEPSKVVSEQYQNTTIVKKNGDDFTGRVVEEDERKVVLVADPIKQDRVEVRRSEIQRLVPAKLSPMPEGLVNILTKEEILDLLAYLESGGNASHAAFK